MLETINLDNGLTTAGQSLAPFGSLFTQSGILRPNSFTVSALGSPGMFVEVSGSDDDDLAIIKTDDGATYFIRNTIDLQVPILANSSGVTKTDAIVLFVDLTGGDDENAGSPGAAQVIAVRRDGVSTGLPNDGEIDAETGNNPWIFLKGVEVEHGAGEVEGEDLEGAADRAHLDMNLIDAGSILESMLAAGSVSNAKLKTGAGEPGGEWTNYTAALTSAGSGATLGNGSMITRYRKIGRSVKVQGSITRGSTTNFGSSTTYISLPFTASNSAPVRSTGVARALDSSSGTAYICASSVSNNDNRVGFVPHNVVGAVTNTNPFAWAVDDALYFEVEYETDS